MHVPVNYWNIRIVLSTEFFNLLKFYGILVIPTEILNLVQNSDTIVISYEVLMFQISIIWTNLSKF